MTIDRADVKKKNEGKSSAKKLKTNTKWSS